MGDITIKIPQDTNGNYEITDRDAAEQLLRDLKKKSTKTRVSKAKKSKDFSDLSNWLKKYLDDADPETLDAIKTAEEWRKRWDR